MPANGCHERMHEMFRKTLIASALSGALALTSFATPVAADPGGQDYARALVGALAVGALAKAISDNKKSDTPVQYYRDDRRNDWRDNNWRDGRRDGWRDDRRGGWRGLSARCEFKVQSRRGGWIDVFGEDCLRQDGIRVNQLPRQCEFTIRTQRGNRDVYGEDCLRGYGYSLDARRR